MCSLKSSIKNIAAIRVIYLIGVLFLLLAGFIFVGISTTHPLVPLLFWVGFPCVMSGIIIYLANLLKH